MEVANLSVKLSADVEQAISGLRKSDAALQKSATVASKESKKIEGFMGKMKMGWIAVAAGAIASLYAVAKSSAVIGGYFSEFGMLVGTVFDEIGIAMAPIIDPLLDFLWMLEDKFAALPEPIKAAIGIIILVGTAIAVLIPIIGLIAPAFATGIASITPILAGFFAFMLANPIILVIVAIIAAIALLYIAWTKNWGGIREKTAAIIEFLKKKIVLLKEAFLKIWNEIKSIYKIVVKPIFEAMKTFIGAIWDTIKLIFATAFLIIKAILTGDTELLRKVWEKFGERLREIWGKAWDRIKNLLGTALSTIIGKLRSYKDKFVEFGRNLPKAIIEGIGDIGAKIWSALTGGLSSVATKISNWASGIIGLSPTLLEIGAKIPKTLMTGAMNIPLNINKMINTHLAIPGIEGIGDIGASSRNITNSRTIIISPTIYISGEMRTDTDLRKLASDLSVYFKDEIKRQVRG